MAIFGEDRASLSFRICKYALSRAVNVFIAIAMIRSQAPARFVNKDANVVHNA